jgi:hypothetical protein
LRCHLDLKCIILPRQARDKHRESTQKKSVRPNAKSQTDRQTDRQHLVLFRTRCTMIILPRQAQDKQMGKLLNKKAGVCRLFICLLARLSRPVRPCTQCSGTTSGAAAEKRLFRNAISCFKNEDLPRQARDKHRKFLKTGRPHVSAGCSRACRVSTSCRLELRSRAISRSI